MRRQVAIVFLVLLGVLAVLPWGLYEIGLGNINGRPAQPESLGLTDAEALKLWNELKETGPVKVEKLNPYRYVLLLLGYDTYEPCSGERLAWFVARNHNDTNLKDNRISYWHLSGAALTIWLTRNWSTELLLAKAQEIRQEKGTASNPVSTGRDDTARRFLKVLGPRRL